MRRTVHPPGHRQDAYRIVRSECPGPLRSETNEGASQKSRAGGVEGQTRHLKSARKIAHARGQDIRPIQWVSQFEF